jgi:hypothetical protein
MAGHGQRSEGTEISSVFESNQAERDDDEEYGLLMDVPAEQERRIAAEGDRTDERVPCRLEQQADQKWLYQISRASLSYCNHLQSGNPASVGNTSEAPHLGALRRTCRRPVRV